MSRLLLALLAFAAFAVLFALAEPEVEDEYPCAVAWTATDAEYEAHVACDLARNPNRRTP